MKNTIFKGVATALVTPMTEGGAIDFDSFGRLVEFQIEQGINALVVCGTTGEASTLTDEEHKELIKYCVERVNKRVPVIAGTGGNDTAYSISLSQYACKVGADACLCVTPYYNKTTQKGLINMFTEIADNIDKPVILYNVPGRTGVNIAPSTYEALSYHKNICAIKEANGDISKAVETMSLVKDRLDLYCGNDDQIVPFMSIGGNGVISVLSNVLPKETVEMCNKFFQGNVKESAEMQLKLKALIDALFCEVNPIPAKAAASAMGYGENVLRSPLYPMEEANRQKLLKLMREQGLKV